MIIFFLPHSAPLGHRMSSLPTEHLAIDMCLQSDIMRVYCLLYSAVYTSAGNALSAVLSFAVAGRWCWELGIYAVMRYLQGCSSFCFLPINQIGLYLYLSLKHFKKKYNLYSHF